MRTTRRGALGTALALGASGCATLSPRRDRFVRRSGTGFTRDGAPYRITGANLWYAAWLGAQDQPRLGRELDRLQALGINNLRIMAAAEEGPLRNSMAPGFTRPDGSPREEIFAGLDRALAEIARRSMTAVLVLGNFWEWSGGFATLLQRAGEPWIDMNDPAHPWPAFADSSARLYGNRAAVALYRRQVAALLARRNSVTGQPYAEDPAIMSWQLANEPRPGGSDGAIAANRAAYLAWIADTASLIRAGAPNHLVSLGQEGLQATNGQGDLVLDAHRPVDYLTAHIWPLNWGWARGDDLAGTWDTVERETRAYLARHRELAIALGQPLLVEEFGFPRDGEAYGPGASTRWREKFYALIYAAVESDWASGGPIAGSNFWAWNGEARAQHADARYRVGDTALMGDPPHEPQGWYGNFDTDEGMAALIRSNVEKRRSL